MTPTCDKIKVMHIITRFDKGGSAENTFLTVRGLDRDRYDVLLVAGASHPANSQGHSGGPERVAIEANIADMQANGVRLINVPELIRELRPLADLSALVRLVRIIRRESPDIVHTHTSKAGILGRWAAFLCRVPLLIHTPHGHVFWGYFKPWQTRIFVLLERWTARITDRIVALTPRERDDHLRFRIAPEEKFAVIHSGVDLSTFRAGLYQPSEIKALLGIPPGMTVVGTVGRLIPVKGQGTLIRAIAELLREGERVSLVLLGEGELRKDLEELSLRLGMADQILFLGWRPDVARIMAACDIFCLPSRNEGMGKVLVEAMAMGKPVVASDTGGIPDLVRNGDNGILFPAGDVAACKAAIARLCRDPGERRRMGDAGIRTAPRYSSEEMIEKIDRLYGKLLIENNRAWVSKHG